MTTPSYPKNTGFMRLVKALCYTYRGLKHALLHEAAFRQECLLALVLVPLAVWLPVTPLEKALLVGALLLVLLVELLNTGIEAVVDRVGLEFHELAGRAKDMGSAAVMLSLLNAAIVWGVIVWPLVPLAPGGL